MNKFKGNIVEVEVAKSLSSVKTQVGDTTFSTILIDTPATASYLQEGQEAWVMFKETEVVMATGKDHSISLQNRVEGTISKLEKGELLSKVVVATSIGDLISIITTNAVNQLELKSGDAVIAMIKSNEIMLSE